MPSMKDGEMMAFGPYPWAHQSNTSNPIARQSEATYLDYLKIKGFEDVGYFLLPYVVSGGFVTKNIKHNDMIDVSEIVVVIDNDVTHRNGASFKTKIPSATYYLDFTKEGDFDWGTSHASGVINVDYLPVAEVNTDAASNVSTIVDKADPRGGFRLKSEYGLFGYMRPITNILDFGAKGNGVTDDTQAFKDAIASLGSIGGTVYVPIGHYVITDTIYINTPIAIIGDGYSWSDGKTYLSFKMDGKPLTSPAILIDTTQNLKISGFYIANNGTEMRNGIAIDGTVHGATAGFVTIEHCFVFGFDKNIYVNDSWFFRFSDIHSKGGNYGFYIFGGVITTTFFDHCYADGNATYGYYINGAYYTTLIACACDSQLTGYRISNCQALVMLGCGSESTVNTAIDIDNSTVTIEGFSSVASGSGTDVNFATMLNVQSGHVNAKGFSEIAPGAASKIASVSIGSGVTGSYITSGQELKGIFFPKNGRFLLDGQAYTNGVPTAIAWKDSDIGKVVHEQAAVEAGTAGSKYVLWGYKRLTAGNGNVLGTDWLPMRALTGN